MALSLCGGLDVPYVPTQRSAPDEGRLSFLAKAGDYGCLSCVEHFAVCCGLDLAECPFSDRCTALDLVELERPIRSLSVRCDDCTPYSHMLCPIPYVTGLTSVPMPVLGVSSCSGLALEHVPTLRSFQRRCKRGRHWSYEGSVLRKKRKVALDTALAVCMELHSTAEAVWQPGDVLEARANIRFVPASGAAASSPVCSCDDFRLEPLPPKSLQHDRIGLGFVCRRSEHSA